MPELGLTIDPGVTISQIPTQNWIIRMIKPMLEINLATGLDRWNSVYSADSMMAAAAIIATVLCTK